ncbi:MAG: phosphonate C-P lyase system protein PhnG [Chloroflexota bacterium]|nr:phosphonate C-P lyase system protein PhnG [Chloroflexota bacterium]
MERTRRCELLARLPDPELARLVTLVVDEGRPGLVVRMEPTVGMVMARAIDGARGEVFNLGEILVTECQVSVGDHEGWSMLAGNRPRGAYWAAAIDAALAGGHAGQDRLDAELRSLIAVQDDRLQAERDRLATTIVQFETW